MRNSLLNDLCNWLSKDVLFIAKANFFYPRCFKLKLMADYQSNRGCLQFPCDAPLWKGGWCLWKKILNKYFILNKGEGGEATEIVGAVAVNRDGTSKRQIMPLPHPHSNLRLQFQDFFSNWGQNKAFDELLKWSRKQPMNIQGNVRSLALILIAFVSHGGGCDVLWSDYK